MARKIPPTELQRREDAITAVLESSQWMRPIEIARRSGISFRQTVSTLKRLEADQRVRRREYAVPAVRGRGRKRKTSKPIVEYQLIPAASWPAVLLPKIAPVVGARVVHGRASAE